MSLLHVQPVSPRPRRRRVASAATLVALFFISGSPVPAQPSAPGSDGGEVSTAATPVASSALHSEDVTFPGGAEAVALAGTLLRPDAAAASPGGWPAVVLVSGSGAQDRDESIMNRKPFRVLAEGLAARGFAVLRYDDRGTKDLGVGASTGDFTTALTSDFAQDAAAAMRWLATQPGIDARRISLLGHSEGGLVAAMLLAQDAVPGAVVLLGGPAVPGSEVITHQQAIMLRRLIELGIGTMTSDVAEMFIQAQRDLIAAALQEDQDAARAVAQRIVRAQVQLMQGASEPTDEQIAPIVNNMLASLEQPWTAAFMRYDPAPDLAQAKVPILALYGGLDLQVDPKQNVGPMLDILMSIDEPRSRVTVLPRHNHLFQQADTGLLGEYGTLPGDLDPAVVELIADWLDAALPASGKAADGHAVASESTADTAAP